MNPLLLAVIPYLALSLGLGFSICLFVLLKAELHRKITRLDQGRKDLESSVAKLLDEFQRLQEETRKSVQEAAMIAEPPSMSPPRQAINLSRRAQILRMAKRGDRPDQICAALGMPLNEVELLLKIQAVQTASA